LQPFDGSTGPALEGHAQPMTVTFRDAEEVAAALAAEKYIADHGLATAVFLALRLRRPLFLEGEPGVGKTALAIALAAVRRARFIRLQCYGGIDASRALYDWDFPRQLLALRGVSETADVTSVYSERFLVPRPILRAVRHEGPVVLLIDEIDRADDEFESFLLEVLETGSVTVPELDESTPIASEMVVVLTSNRTREVHDALKRRCIYHWIEHPDVALEARILREQRPEIPQRLADEVATVMRQLRLARSMIKKPGVSEALDFCDSLQVLRSDTVGSDAAELALGTVIKHREDQAAAQEVIAAYQPQIFEQRRPDE
jgi:MoxR-like ATPase